jgi:hypothetical protein
MMLIIFIKRLATKRKDFGNKKELATKRNNFGNKKEMATKKIILAARINRCPILFCSI